jgi:hypothetical protein
LGAVGSISASRSTGGIVGKAVARAQLVQPVEPQRRRALVGVAMSPPDAFPQTTSVTSPRRSVVSA